MKILIINNKDSFVYNLVDYVSRIAQCNVTIVPNTFSLNLIEELKPDRIIISPGPGHPQQTGNVIPMIKKYYKRIPILGVCLGHQAIAEAFEADVKKAKVGPRHGKISNIFHDGKTIYQGIPNPFEGMRYHSLEVVEDSLPDCFEISSIADDKTIMGIRHKDAPLEGVQFHPESISTNEGLDILKNFVKINFSEKEETMAYA
jgi:anthranilate synthase/aminodeoxychorismate synthase-like glutamine amidotransferase